MNRKWLLIKLVGALFLSSCLGSKPSPPAEAHQLHTLPVVTDALGFGHLILLDTTNGLLALYPRQTKPVAWERTTEIPLAELLATQNYARFGDTFYLSGGRWADLSQLSYPVSGTAIISPDGRYAAYETLADIVSDRPGPYIYVEDLALKDGRPILAEARLFAWHKWIGSDAFIFAQTGSQFVRLDLNKLPVIPHPLAQFAPGGETRPLTLSYETTYTGNTALHKGGLVWRSSTHLWATSIGDHHTLLTDQLHPERAIALAPDGNTLAWIQQEHPQLQFHVFHHHRIRLDYRYLNVNVLSGSQNPIFHLTWSPDGTQMVIWAAGPCAEHSSPPADCYGDLFLVDLNAESQMDVVRLTDSQIPYHQVKGLHWLPPDAAAPPPPTTPSIRLSQLPVTTGSTAAADLIVLATHDGPLVLDSAAAALSAWPVVEAELGAVLAGPHVQFGGVFYNVNGQYANLTQRPRPAVGRILASPNGRFIAYEIAEPPDATEPGTQIYLYDVVTGQEERAANGDSDLLGWSSDSRFLYMRYKRNYLQVEPLGLSGERVNRIDEFGPDLTPWPAIQNTADGRLVWQGSQAYNNMMPIFITQWDDSTRRDRRLVDQLYAPYRFTLSPDGEKIVYFQPDSDGFGLKLLADSGSQRQFINQSARVHHLAWSPDSGRLLIWATTDCLMTNSPAVVTGCYGDLYLLTLNGLTTSNPPSAIRLTNSRLPYTQVTGLHWFNR